MGLIVGRHVIDEVYFIEVNGQREMLTTNGISQFIDVLVGLLPVSEEPIPGSEPLKH